LVHLSFVFEKPGLPLVACRLAPAQKQKSRSLKRTKSVLPRQRHCCQPSVGLERLMALPPFSYSSVVPSWRVSRSMFKFNYLDEIQGTWRAVLSDRPA
jgi:hypothetical protein